MITQHLKEYKEEEAQKRAVASASLLAALSVYTSVLTTMAVTDRTDLLKTDSDDSHAGDKCTTAQSAF